MPEKSHFFHNYLIEIEHACVCILFLDFRIKPILAYLRVVDIMSPQNAGILYLMAFQIFIIFFRLAGNFLQRYWIFEWEFAYKEGGGIFVKVS